MSIKANQQHLFDDQICESIQLVGQKIILILLKLSRKETRLDVQFDVLEPDAHEPGVHLEDAVVVLLGHELEQNVLQLRKRRYQIGEFNR